MANQTESLRLEFRVKLEPPRRPPRRRPLRAPRPIPSLRYALVLGHQVRKALEKGEFDSNAGIGRHLGLTEMRVSQLLALTLLAPNIQRAILMASDGILRRIPERLVRPVTRLPLWEAQQRTWEKLLAELADDKPA